MSRTCEVATGRCTWQVGSHQCYHCGNWACGNCCATRLWKSYRKRGGWKVRQHCICDNCWMENLEERERKAQRRAVREVASAQ